MSCSDAVVPSLVCLAKAARSEVTQVPVGASDVREHAVAIFVAEASHKLARGTAAETFRRLLDAAGIKGPEGGPTPHLHDLRHKFAIKALTTCPDSRDRVARHMLALTTYMGHARVESTYYLDTTPQLMSDIASTCETFLKGNLS